LHYEEPPHFIKYRVTFYRERVRILDQDSKQQQIRTRRGRALRGDYILAANEAY